MRARIHRILPLLLLLAACAAATAGDGLPDLDRGIAALEAGDFEAAERDLRPLAERGYLEAQVRMARLYAQLGVPGAIDEAVYWYRLALKRDPTLRVALAKALIQGDAIAAGKEIDQLLREADEEGQADALHLRLRLYREQPQLAAQGEAADLARRAGRSKYREDIAEAISWYRANADANPEFRAEAAVLCKDAKAWVGDCYVDLVRHYRVIEDEDALSETQDEAVALYEDMRLPAETIERMAHSLVTESLPGPRLDTPAFELFSLVADQSLTAKTRAARMLVDQPDLDPDADPRPMLEEASAAGSAEASFYLGRLYMDEHVPYVDPARAEQLLMDATAVDPRAHFYLGRLYERGYLGRAEPQRAFDHYLEAARSGYARADLALAQMFSGNRGVRVDPVNAYAFARLAAHQQVPGGNELLMSLHSTIGQEHAALGQRKAEAEFEARQQAGLQTPMPDGPADAQSAVGMGDWGRDETQIQAQASATEETP